MIMVPRYFLKICMSAEPCVVSQELKKMPKNHEKFVKRYSERVGKNFKLTGK